MIWKQEISIEALTERARGTFAEFLGIVFTNIGKNELSAEVKVASHHLQPGKILNGGFNCALAESVASAAANHCCEKGEYCIGLDINTNHTATVREGELLEIVARPYHLGKSTQVWEISTHVGKRMTSISRLTLLVKRL